MYSYGILHFQRIPASFPRTTASWNEMSPSSVVWSKSILKALLRKQVQMVSRKLFPGKKAVVPLIWISWSLSTYCDDQKSQQFVCMRYTLAFECSLDWAKKAQKWFSRWREGIFVMFTFCCVAFSLLSLLFLGRLLECNPVTASVFYLDICSLCPPPPSHKWYLCCCFSVLSVHAPLSPACFYDKRVVRSSLSYSSARSFLAV